MEGPGQRLNRGAELGARALAQLERDLLSYSSCLR